MVKIKYKLIVLFFVLFATLQIAYAYDFTINDISGPTSKPYQGQTVDSLMSSITMADNTCKLTCYWETENHGGLDNPEGLIGTNLISGQTKNFGPKVEAKGTSGYTSNVLTIKCRGEQAWNCYPWPSTPPIETKTKQINFNFDYNGDSACTTRDNLESCVNAKSDCACSQYKSCIDNKGDQSRNDLDEKKCATYCGNKVIENPYELCSNCPNDVGKCDGLQCFTGSECEGKFCVHNKCSRLAYIIGDGYCDTNVGENCNSKQDCPCESNTRCEISSPNADYKGCATWCGNNVCEGSEQRICKADCQWCGDGTCENSESCSSCDVDCGACKKPTKEEELQRNTQTKDIQTKQTTQTSNPQTGTTNSINKEQKTVSLLGKDYNLTTVVVMAIALIVFLAAVSFFIYKKVKSNKKEENKDKKHHTEKKEHDEPKVTRCEKCNKKIDEDTKFCPHCGHKIE